MDSDILGCMFHYAKGMGFGYGLLAEKSFTLMIPCWGFKAGSQPRISILCTEQSPDGGEALFLSSRFCTMFVGLQYGYKCVQRGKEGFRAVCLL